MENQSIILTREQLYKKVWSQPVWTLAKEWGISDVGLAKICKKNNIPRPGLGYWARKEHGYNPRQTPLPKGEDNNIEIHSRQESGVVDGERWLISRRSRWRSSGTGPRWRASSPKASGS